MSEDRDLIVVGGGVMGLFCAHHAASRGARVTVLERGRIGDPMTASFGRTRSYRSDYLDPAYVRLAREAYRLWGEFERRTGHEVLVRCGCMNIARRSVTPDLDATYAELSQHVLAELGVPTASYRDDALRERYPFLTADLAHVDLDGGVVNLPAVTAALLASLEQHGADIREGVELERATSDGVGVRVNAGGAQLRRPGDRGLRRARDQRGAQPPCRARACRCRSPATGRSRRATTRPRRSSARSTRPARCR